MSDSIFLADGELFVPTEQASGPWDPQALHGGAPAALITAAFERLQPGGELVIARLGFELLRPVPLAPLRLSVRIVRPGRRVQELAAELHSAGELICRASALRVQAVPDGLPALREDRAAASASVDRPMPGPDSGAPVRFALDDPGRASFASSVMEMRWLDDPWEPGPARVWMRMRHPLLPGEALTPLARLAATSDFGNGVGAVLAFSEYLFINADLTIHLSRAPRGEWIGLDARTLVHAGGAGLAESVIHDSDGPVGRAFQTLVVQPR
jgi:acyl-Coa thioesterase superfamily protein/acyl-CoA thioesterase superfamily protein